MKAYKKNVEQQNLQALAAKEQQLTKNIDLQVRKFKRQQLMGFHNLEQRLLIEVFLPNNYMPSEKTFGLQQFF